MHVAERVFAAFAVLLAAIALTAFWPPDDPRVIAWLVIWCGLCLVTATAILRRSSYAPASVWALVGLTILSALAALRDGMLDALGMVIDIVLFIPLIWFAVWYQGRSRTIRRREQSS